jgi:hypothetical protein
VAARQQTDKYQLDKSHVFSVHMLDDIDKYARAPDTYTPPEPKPFKTMVRSGTLAQLAQSVQGHFSLLNKLKGSEAAGLWNSENMPVFQRACVYA